MKCHTPPGKKTLCPLGGSDRHHLQPQVKSPAPPREMLIVTNSTAVRRPSFSDVFFPTCQLLARASLQSWPPSLLTSLKVTLAESQKYSFRFKGSCYIPEMNTSGKVTTSLLVDHMVKAYFHIIHSSKYPRQKCCFSLNILHYIGVRLMC